MKALKDIKKAIAKNAAAIDAAQKKIAELDFSAEKKEAAQRIAPGRFNSSEFHTLCEKARANADAIAAESEKLYRLEIERRILKDNARAALVAEAWPVIREACEKYAGKPYGEKTRDAIRKAVNAAGYSFYFDGYSAEKNRVHIYELENGYTGHGLEADAHAVEDTENGRSAYFIGADNRIFSEAVTASSRAKYTENTAKAAREIAKAIRAYSEATKAIEAQRRELADMLPDGIKSPDYIKEYYVIF